MLACRVVYVHDAAIQIEDQDRVGETAEQQLETVVELAKLGGQARALGLGAGAFAAQSCVGHRATNAGNQTFRIVLGHVVADAGLLEQGDALGRDGVRHQNHGRITRLRVDHRQDIQCVQLWQAVLTQNDVPWLLSERLREPL